MIEKYISFTLSETYVDHERCIGKNCPLEKIASSKSSLIDSVDQRQNHAYFHVIAMGAGDFYNENNNGDFFYEKDLVDYFETFLTAGIFIQHDNKNPEKTLGKVIKAIYNDEMHRVELILEVCQTKSPSIYQRAKAGERLAVSMGVKVPKESCSYCGHITQGSISNRCEHLTFMMHKQMENGQIVYAINHPPMNFFDISFVRKPADTQGHAIFTKVANSIGDEHTEASIDKVAELIKYVDAATSMPRPKKEDLDTLKEYGPQAIPKLMRGKGIFILPSEALYLVDAINFDELSGCSSAIDNEYFIRKLLNNHKGEGSCSSLSGSVSIDKPGLNHLSARTILVKKASYSHKKQDAFGNKFRAMDSPRDKKSLRKGFLGTGEAGNFAQLKVNFHDGESVTMNQSPMMQYGVPEYYLDLVREGYAENIMGIMANGNEKVIFRG